MSNFFGCHVKVSEGNVFPCIINLHYVKRIFPLRDGGSILYLKPDNPTGYTEEEKLYITEAFSDVLDQISPLKSSENGK